jgi:GNAT superfamily N-acetyltransferase
MTDPTFRRWIDLAPAEQIRGREEIKKIFFASSSRQNFKTEAERESFWQNWTAYYFTHEPQLIEVIESGGHLIGYLTGCRDTLSAAVHFRWQMSFGLFADLWARYPSHLHMNLSAEARGHGHGKVLIQRFCQTAGHLSACGVHIVTSPSERNVGFYRQAGFDFAIERDFNGARLLFMGLSIKK